MKSQVLHSVWCNISGEAAGEIWTWPLLGVKELNIEKYKQQNVEWSETQRPLGSDGQGIWAGKNLPTHTEHSAQSFMQS